MSSRRSKREKPQKPEPVVQPVETAPTESSTSYLAPLALTGLALAVRFHRISHPDEVVFDEVHFGKFASYYLQGTYFFDVHPPFAKLLYAFLGKLIGYNGEFLFDSIGLNYITAKVPYVAYRALSATQGALAVTLIFETLKHAGFSVLGSLFGALLVLFDTGHVTESRLILLDSTLTLSVMASAYCYVRFMKHRSQPFGPKWWAWLVASGIALSCAISTKYVGVFTFVMVGMAVVMDLVRLIDIKSKLSIREVVHHFIARFACLVVLPLAIFLFWFYVHFRMLPNSGPGDDFMSTAFRATLGANPAMQTTMDVCYGDTITIRSKVGEVYLHSHDAKYPQRYDDGRVSTGGQQVTGYSFQDRQNEWIILPGVHLADGLPPNTPVLLGHTVRLFHVSTQTFLLTQDVASPGYPTNEEITTVSPQVAEEKFNYTLFTLEGATDDKTSRLRTSISKFRLEHVETPVNVWLSDKKLPDWGFGQSEINGAKRPNTSPSTVWAVDDLPAVVDKDSRRTSVQDGPEPRRSFFVDYFELQGTMFRKNNQLTSTHPYQSTPDIWPFLTRGVSYWEDTKNRGQIYLLGNYFGYWCELLALVLYLLVLLVDYLTRLREEALTTKNESSKLRRTLSFFWLGWAVHYFPFFLMKRQLFLHHYLPAHAIGALVTGGIVDVLFGAVSARRPAKKTVHTIAVVALSTVLIGMFVFFSPIAYGENMTAEQAQRREWFNVSLKFSK